MFVAWSHIGSSIYFELDKAHLRNNEALRIWFLEINYIKEVLCSFVCRQTDER